MNCNELKQQLEAAVEARTPLPLGDWREHLEKCHACRRACEDHQLLDRAVREWARVRHTPDLTEQILAILEGEDLPQKSVPASGGYRISLITILATVAAVILIVLNSPKKTNDDPPTMLVNGPAFNETDLESPDNVDLEQVILETRNAYGSLLGQAQSTIDPLKAAITESEQDKSASADNSTHIAQLQLVPAELEPLKAELTQSFGFLADLFPDRGSR